ncbi:DUF1963 domain-containing protein [Microlunatus antarcticus]|uniref:Uncharacterized protein YwqG n=1 Tax=Microlunatus antarcticus TaxID=53388 RepID=A0A7W5P712_9ACTN|nr:DUF1963 domain-containing protein [Microlunatus antarcticus]MBB3327095.1 uncharacterized protein YwqG [Microlunatus antarcticus]
MSPKPFGKRKKGGAAHAVREEVRGRLRQRLAELAAPCVRVDLASDDAASPPTGSCLGEGAYLPHGQPWPIDENGPMCFVAQINFAEAPKLVGFPERGLLQWFTSADDTYGLTFDESRGTVGFLARWFDDVSAPSVGEEPDDVDTDWSPVGDGRLILTEGLSLPAWKELPEDVRAEPLWQEVTDVLGDKGLAAVGYELEPEDVWEDLARGYESPLVGFVVGSKIGGFARFTQTDPRGDGAYPARNAPRGSVLLQLDSGESGGWGDGGVGQLFADPSAVAGGDLSSVRYNWDCG